MSATNAQGKNVVRMGREDILKLKDTINPNLKEEVENLKKAYPYLAHTAFDSLDEIIRAIDEYEENEKARAEEVKDEQPSQEGEQQPSSQEGKEVPQEEVKDEQPQQPSSTQEGEQPSTQPSAESQTSELFEMSSEFVNLLCEKVRELKLMLDNADNDTYSPVSIGSINNIGMSLVRRIFFISNEEAIREKTNGRIVYPYVNVDQSLLSLMRDVFLKMYFTPFCDDLIPLYVYSAIPFCRNTDIYRKNKHSSKRPVYFNRTYPVDGIRDDEIDQWHLFDRVNNMKKNNPPGSKPYHYEEPTFNEDEFPSLI